MATKELRKRKRVKKGKTRKARKQRGGEYNEKNFVSLLTTAAENKEEIKKICEDNVHDASFNNFVKTLNKEYGELLKDCIEKTEKKSSSESPANKEEGCIIS